MSKPIGVAKLSPQGQISIPQQIKKLLSAEIGDYILFFQNEKGEVVIVTKVKAESPLTNRPLITQVKGKVVGDQPIEMPTEEDIIGSRD